MKHKYSLKIPNILNMKNLITALILLFLFNIASSQQIAQWNGPSRNGIFPETDLLKKWPDGGPHLIMRIEGVGRGFSQPVVYRNIIYITGIKKDTMDVISAYDSKGTLLWDNEYGISWKGTYPDTRSSPTIENGRIYLISGMGEMVCLDLKTGKILWSHNPFKEFKGKTRAWGIAESVLLTDKVAVTLIGGDETTVVAYNKIDGTLAWKTKSVGGARAYSSPILIERGGQKLIVAQGGEYMLGIDPENGNLIWTYKTIQHFKGTTDLGRGDFTNTPLYYNGGIFISSGYTMPGVMLNLAKDGKSVSFKWENVNLNPHHGGYVLMDGTLYGSTWKTNSQGSWSSVDWNTGQLNWMKEWHTKGSIIGADGMLYIFEEKNGNVALVQPDKKDLKIISTFKIKPGTGMHFAHPSIYNGNLYLRDGDVLMVYNIKAGKK
jgi:outer membrane protein assembly factor BamB